MNTYVIACSWISDEDFDRGDGTTGTKDIKATSQAEAVANLREQLGERLLAVHGITCWRPGDFDKHVAGITSK